MNHADELTRLADMLRTGSFPVEYEAAPVVRAAAAHIRELERRHDDLAENALNLEGRLVTDCRKIDTSARPLLPPTLRRIEKPGVGWIHRGRIIRSRRTTRIRHASKISRIISGRWALGPWRCTTR